MCIAILNNGVKLSKQELENCWLSNDDGAGMLFIENEKLVVCKYPNEDPYGKAGKSFDEFYTDYLEVYENSSKANKPVVLHFRIATHGFSDAYLHPFLVSDNVGLVHNGIISGYGTKDISDTAEFAQEIGTLPASMLKDLSFLDVEFVFNSIYNIIGDHNKVVFMDKNGDFEILNEDKGHWVGNNWFSNDSYKSLVKYHGNVAKGTAFYDYEVDEDYDKYTWATNKPYITDKNYECDLCEEETMVDWDSCCVECGSYIISAESDVIEKAIQEEGTFI